MPLRKSVLILAAAALAACGDGATEPDPISVTLSPDSLLLNVNQTQTLTVTVTGTTQAATFTSTHSSIAEVSAGGNVTGRSPGTAFIRATVGNARDSTKVVVATPPAEPPPPPPPPPVQLPLLGTGSVPERTTAEVAAAGNFAYTTTWGTRLVNGVVTRGNAVKIWNVAGNVPQLIDSLIIANVGTVSDVQISSDGALLVVSLESSNPNTANGIAIYDRSEPAAPTLITHYAPQSLRAGVHTIKLGRIDGRHYAFLSVNRGALVIVDITTPAAPVDVLDRVMGNPGIHDVFIRDGILFAALWDDGMTIFDVGGAGRGGSPQNPVQIGNVKTVGGSVHNIWWFHDPSTGLKRYAFIGEETLDYFFRHGGDVHVVDVSDMSNPREIAFYRPLATSTSDGHPAGAHNFDMDEPSGMLYAAFYNGGVRVLDVRGDLNSCTPAQRSADGRCDLRLMGREVGVAQAPTPTDIWGVKLVGSFLYASDMVNGIHKYDVSALKR